MGAVATVPLAGLAIEIRRSPFEGRAAFALFLVDDEDERDLAAIGAVDDANGNWSWCREPRLPGVLIVALAAIVEDWLATPAAEWAHAEAMAEAEADAANAAVPQ